ncbi:MAG: rod shape-determining protein MreC [Gemmatimonas sp.]
MARAVRTASQLDTGLLILCGVLSLAALVMPDWMQESVATAIRRTVLAPLVDVQQKAEVMRTTIVTRDSVQQTRGALVGESLSAPALEIENAQLRQMIGLGSRLRNGFVSAEALRTGTLDREFTLTVSAGSNAGVEPLTPVVTADGLVGQVVTVDPTFSTAISWAHPDFAVSAMSIDGSAFGIVKPHLGTGAQRWLLELHGVPFRAPLTAGTEIVTSGLGGTYPRTIPVGTVISEIQTTEKWVRTYLLKPAVLPNTPGPVLLLIPSRSPKDVNGVWTTLTSSDSATRSIVAAGDSMARQAAMAEVLARNAARDSAVMDSVRNDSLARLGLPPLPARVDTSRRTTAPRDTTRRPQARPDTVGKPKPPTGPPPPLEGGEMLTEHQV